MSTLQPNGGIILSLTDGAAEANTLIPENTRVVRLWAVTKAQWVRLTDNTTAVLASNEGTTGKAAIVPPIAGAYVDLQVNPGKYAAHTVSAAVADADGSRVRPGAYLHYKPAETGGTSTLYVSYFK